MNFLELCRELASEAGISGASTAPISVAGQSGEMLRVVNWVREAYRLIQTEHADWEFLRADVSFDTTGAKVYTAAAAGIEEFGEWRFKRNDWRSYNAALGVIDEQPVCYMPYDQFKRTYLYGSNREQVGRPLIVTERPDQSLQFWPLVPEADAVYTILGEQFRAPHRLVANTDVPIFPAQFHQVIVNRAKMLNAEYEGDASLFSSAQSATARDLAKMEERYLPEWESTEPLA